MSIWQRFLNWLHGVKPAPTPAPSPSPAPAPNPTPAPAPAPSADYVVTDGFNGLVQFPEVTGLPYWGAFSWAYEGAKAAFDPNSQAWHTIDWNCAQVQYALDHPSEGLLAQRVVYEMRYAPAPGGSASYWQPIDPVVRASKSLALPSGIKTKDAALAYIRALNVPSDNPDFPHH